MLHHSASESLMPYGFFLIDHQTKISSNLIALLMLELCSLEIRRGLYARASGARRSALTRFKPEGIPQLTLKAIAQTSHRLDMARLRRLRLDLQAQPPDKIIYGARRAFKAPTPDPS